MQEREDEGAKEVTVTDEEAEEAIERIADQFVGQYAVLPLEIGIADSSEETSCARCNNVDLVEERGIETADYRLYAGDPVSSNTVDRRQHSIPICGTCLLKTEIVEHASDVHYQFADEETRELMDGGADHQSEEEF